MHMCLDLNNDGEGPERQQNFKVKYILQQRTKKNRRRKGKFHFPFPHLGLNLSSFFSSRFSKSLDFG